MILRTVIRCIVIISSLYLFSETIYALDGVEVPQNALGTGIIVEGVWESTWGIHKLMAHFLQQRFKDCHLLVIIENSDISVGPLLKRLETWNRPIILVDTSQIWMTSNSSKNVLTDKFFIGDPRKKCRVAIAYLDTSIDDTLMRFLEEADFWKYPSMKVFAIGPKERRQEFLLHYSLRNVIHALYFAPLTEEDEIPLEELFSRENSIPSLTMAVDIGLDPSGKKLTYSSGKFDDYTGLDVYFHCFYCDNGKSQVIFVERWGRGGSLTSQEKLFPDQFKNFNGHLMRIVTMPFFPFIDFTPDSEEPMSTVTLKESLDLVLLTEISMKLNFTYILRLPVDKEWAQPLDNGSWTGLVGTLQREDADFSTCLFYDYGRMQACDFTRLFAPDPMVIISRKAKPLPPYLAIIKPFSELMWVGIALAFVVAGTAFWVLQTRWEVISSEEIVEDTLKGRVAKWESCPEYFDFSSSMFFTWALLLQQQPYEFPPHLHGRLWTAWWLIFSLLVLSIYRSALIASLSVPQMSEPVDSFEQLLDRKGWTSGMEPHYSVGWLWLKNSQNPGIQTIFGELEFLQIPDHMQRIGEQGDHALISWTNYIRNIIISDYTDRNGYTPMYMSRQRYMGTGCSWATRRGMPYYRTLDNIQQHLVEGNFMQLWLNDIFKITFKKSREKNTTSTYVQDEGGQVVFSLFHMQGAFYILFMGLTVSTPVFLMEYFCWGRKHSLK